MSSERTAPQACTNMIEVRYGVDRLDEEIVRLIGERFRYMDAAARIKPERTQVRDEARKAQVITNARAYAIQNQFPETAAAEIWERLVEASIAYELDRFDAIRGDA